jgi:hypothetical protein
MADTPKSETDKPQTGIMNTLGNLFTPKKKRRNYWKCNTSGRSGIRNKRRI